MSELGAETLAGLNPTRKTLAQRLAKHTRGRQLAPAILPLLSEYSSRRACKLNECGRVLMARDAGTAGSAVSGYYCQQWKLCRICAARRSSKSLSILLPKVNYLMATDPTSKAYLVTLTVKGSPDDECGERFNHLMASVKRYMRTRVENTRNNGSFTEPCKAAGIFSATETTRGTSGNSWHWHCHGIWVVPANVRISHTALSNEWHRATGDSYIVDVRELDASKNRRVGSAIETGALAGDLAEVCKYALKPQGLSPADCITVQKATAGRHFTRTYGSLRFTADETAALEAEQPEVEHAEAPARVFVWHHAMGRYAEQVGTAYDAIDHHPRLLGCRAVNLAEETRKRAESRGVAVLVAPGGLDTGGKIVRSEANRPTGKHEKRPWPRPGRLREAPGPSENCFG